MQVDVYRPDRETAAERQSCLLTSRSGGRSGRADSSLAGSDTLLRTMDRSISSAGRPSGNGTSEADIVASVQGSANDSMNGNSNSTVPGVPPSSAQPASKPHGAGERLGSDKAKAGAAQLAHQPVVATQMAHALFVACWAPCEPRLEAAPGAVVLAALADPQPAKTPLHVNVRSAPCPPTAARQLSMAKCLCRP